MAGQDVQHHGLARAAGATGVAVLLSRIMGLVREQVFAVLFGAGNVMDAFNVAFRIPNLLRNLLAEGALSASLVPVLERARQEQGARAAWRVAGLVFRSLALIVGAFSVAAFVFAPSLVGSYAQTFREVPGKFELTVRLTRILLPFFPMVALAAAFMGVLNACGRFFLPAFSSALFNLGSVLVGVGVAGAFGRNPAWGFQPIEGMALGVLAGGAVQMLCQLPALYREGYRWKKRTAAEPVAWRDPHLRRMLLMMVPGTIGLAATQAGVLVNTVLATSQGAGAVSWLNYAFRFMQFPIGIFGVSLATAVAPVVARQWAQGDVRGAASTLERGLRHAFALNLTASAGLAFLGEPIIELVFQYGRFYPEDTRATALALAMYALGLTAYAVVKLVVPAFYAFGSMRAPVAAGAAALALTVVLNLVMAGPWGFWGLALGTSVAAIVNAVALLWALQGVLERAGQRLDLRGLAGVFLKNLCVALAMGVIVFYTHRILDTWLPDELLARDFGKFGLFLSRLLKVSFGVVEGGAAVWAMSRVLRVRDTTEAADIFVKKLKNKLRRGKT